MLPKLILEVLEVELDLVKAGEAAWEINLLNDLHEVVLTVLRDVARGDLAASAILQALRLDEAELVLAHASQRHLKDDAEERDADALVLNLLAVDLRLEDDTALQVVASLKERSALVVIK